MGNTAGREKGRHFSGEDSGPTMRPPRDEEDMFMGEMDESGEFAPGTFKVSCWQIKVNNSDGGDWAAV